MISLHVLLVVLACVSATELVTIDTPSGQVTGSTSPYDNRVIRFLALPYGNAPRRFEKAELVNRWSGIHDGTRFGKGCMQMPVAGFYPRDDMSENCLTLDIYTPVNTSADSGTSASKAVMVWIHGGGFMSGNSKIFESSNIAADGDVVVVAIQYRLGAFGFLYTREQTTTNLGLYDQRLALEWVQKNIHSFGGDRQRVTVFGVSAGSISISCHMLSPLVDDSLFQRAILQSGSIFNGDKTIQSRDEAVDLIATHAAECNNSDAALDCLRQLSADQLVESAIGAGVTFWPTSGDDYLPVDSLELLYKYHQNGIMGIINEVGDLRQYDLLIGHNGDEGLVMLPYIFPNITWEDGVTDAEYYNSLHDFMLRPLIENATVTEQAMGRIISMYNQTYPELVNKTEEEINLKKSMDIIGDFTLVIPPILHAMLHADIDLANVSSPTQQHTYYYIFDHKPETASVLDQGPDWLKNSANHADELQFLFTSLAKNLSDVEEALRKSMVQYWTNFAKHGNPVRNGSSSRCADDWKEFSSHANSRHYMRITTTADIAERKPRGSPPDFWLQIFADIAGNMNF